MEDPKAHQAELGTQPLAARLFSQFPVEGQDALRAQFASHNDDLVEQANHHSDLVRKYLFVMNAGSAAALVGFMGTAPDIGRAAYAIISLACFAVGILCVGFIHALNYYSGVRTAQESEANTDAFLGDEIVMGEFYSKQAAAHSNAGSMLTANRLGWAATTLWVAGFALMSGGLFVRANSLNEPPIHGSYHTTH